jgi:hypothetical protein
MSPLSEAYSSALRNRKVKNIYNKPKHPISMFQSETYSNLLLVLETLVATEVQTERIRRQLRERGDFTPHLAIQTLAATQHDSPHPITSISWRDL